jgi:hypothetical protein
VSVNVILTRDRQGKSDPPRREVLLIGGPQAGGGSGGDPGSAPARERGAWRKSKVAFTYPSKRSVEAIKYKVKNLTTHSTTHSSLGTLLLQVNSVLRGWATYSRYDASKRTLAYVDYFAWWRVFRWLRKEHPKRTYGYLRNRYCGGRWWINDDGVELFRPAKVNVERYRYRGTTHSPAMDGIDGARNCRLVRQNRLRRHQHRGRRTSRSQSHDYGCLWKAGFAATCTSGLAGGSMETDPE